MRAIIVRKKFWGLQMLTWVWLARAKHELTKPKSTFCPQNFLSGLRASHEQSFPFTWAGAVTGAVVAQGQLSPGGAVVWLGSCHLGSCRLGRCHLGSCRRVKKKAGLVVFTCNRFGVLSCISTIIGLNKFLLVLI